jgi:hypothetical protein
MRHFYMLLKKYSYIAYRDNGKSNTNPHCKSICTH